MRFMLEEIGWSANEYEIKILHEIKILLYRRHLCAKYGVCISPANRDRLGHGNSAKLLLPIRREDCSLAWWLVSFEGLHRN